MNDFIQKDMNKDNIGLYLKEAVTYSDELIVDATISVAASNWKDFSVSNEGASIAEQTYSSMLSDSKKVELYQQSLLRAQQEFRKFKRWAGNGAIGVGVVEQTTLPSGHWRYGGYTQSGSQTLPLFYFDSKSNF